MAHTHSIKKLLNIKDPNIHLAKVPVTKEKKKKVDYIIKLATANEKNAM